MMRIPKFPILFKYKKEYCFYLNLCNLDKTSNTWNELHKMYNLCKNHFSRIHTYNNVCEHNVKSNQNSQTNKVWDDVIKKNTFLSQEFMHY
jgi:hypothetical protein